MSRTHDFSARPSLRWVWITLLVAASLVAFFVGTWLYFGAPGPAYADAPAYWWFPFGAWFIFIPVFIVIFFTFRWFFWGGWGWGWHQGGVDPALEILRERFARAEITKEEYDSMVGDLAASSR